MDQSLFAGPGNIYRAEILFLAGIYPTTPANQLDRESFVRLWNVTVKLLRRGYDTGSILTVDADIDPSVVARGERRYIYNTSNCARCGSSVSSWKMGGRTCYACEGGVCQPKKMNVGAGMVKVDAAAGGDSNTSDTAKKPSSKKVGARKKTGAKKLISKGDASESASKSASATLLKSKKQKKKQKQQQPQQHVPFISHCAPISHRQRLKQGGSQHLTIAEIRSMIEQIVRNNNGADADENDDVAQALPPKSARKAVHVQALDTLLQQQRKKTLQKSTTAEKSEEDALIPLAVPSTNYDPLPPPAISSEEAAREKASSGENRAVEHIAELSREQAAKAIATVTTATTNSTTCVKKEAIDNTNIMVAVTPSLVAVPSETTCGEKMNVSKKVAKKRVNRKRDSAAIMSGKGEIAAVGTPKRRSTRRKR